MTEDQYIPLIHQSLTGQLSAGEQDRLNEWLAASSQHQDIYAEIIAGWEIAENYEAPVTVNTDRAFEQFLAATGQNTSLSSPATILSEEKIVINKTQTPVRRLWPAISAVAAIGLLVIGIIWAWQTTQSSGPALVETTATTPRTLVTLPDQSVITLNEGAKISYHADFDPRRIQLDGEAFFEVTKNPQKPFTILTKNTTTTVLGTSFNINNEATKTTVTVFTGKVSFADRTGKNGSLILTPTERGIYQTTGQTLEKEKEISLQSVNWQKENITYQDATLATILPALENFYGVSIRLKNPSLADCTFTGTFKRDGFKDGLEALAFGMNLRFTKKGETVVLEGEGCE